MRVTRSGSLAFQSTRPRGARHDILHGRRIQPTISIHAPAWGATSSSRRRPARPRHFNPRARVGRDGMVGRQVSTGSYFNPRAHTGRDVCRQNADKKIRISIHAPTRGATSDVVRWAISPIYFNPRAHTGRDDGHQARHRKVCDFNPRAHTGRDGHKSADRPRADDFNPRAHTGRDAQRAYRRLSLYHFNPRAHTGRDAARIRAS